MKYLPTTINATLIFSMIVALLFLPLILSYIWKDKKIDKKEIKTPKIVSAFVLFV
jgi:multidrug efflux pump subunit AcrB